MVNMAYYILEIKIVQSALDGANGTFGVRLVFQASETTNRQVLRFDPVGWVFS